MRQIKASHQHLASSSPLTDGDLLPNMEQLHGLSKDTEGKSVPGLKLDSSPFTAAINKEEKEPPWSRNQSRGGMCNGGRRRHRDGEQGRLKANHSFKLDQTTWDTQMCLHGVAVLGKGTGGAGSSLMHQELCPATL